MRIRAVLTLLVLTALLGGLLSACGGTSEPATSTSGPTTTASPTTGPAGDGAALLQERCTVCHSLDRVTSRRQTAEGWAATVTRMVGRGAQLSEAEQATLVAYLAETYGP